MKIFTLPTKFLLAILFLGSSAEAVTINIISNTNWSAITTGSGPGGLPNSGDVVNIKNGATLTINVSNAVCSYMQVGFTGSNAGHGTLVFNAGSQLTLMGSTGLLTGTSNYIGTIDMTAGGTLSFPKWPNSTVNTVFIPGSGTVKWEGNASSYTLIPVVTTYNNLVLNAAGFTATLGANTTINGNLTITGGTLNTNNFNLTVNGNFINGASSTFSNNAIFTVKGNITNDQASMAVGTGTLQLNGTGAQTINGSQTFKTYNLTTNNTAGITLNNNLSVSNVHTFSAGIITTSATPNYLIYESGSSYNGDADSRHVNGWVKKIGSTNFSFPVGNGTVIRKAVIESLSGSLEFSCKYNGATPNATQVQSPILLVDPNEYWNINRISGSGSAQVHLNWDNSKVIFPQYTIASIRAVYYTGGLWTNVGGSATGNIATTGDITSNSVSSFGEFTFGSMDFYLSLKFSDISVQQKQQFNVIEWQTANENSALVFEIERSVNGTNFEKIGATKSFNTAGVNNYSFKDVQPLQKAAWYRIRSVDANGKVNFSNIVFLNIANASKSIRVINNPASNFIHLASDNTSSGAYEYTVSNLAGLILQKGTLQIINNSKVLIPLSANISSGTYVVAVKNAQYKFCEKVMVK